MNNDYYNTYVQELAVVYGGHDNFATELSGRLALHKLLEAVAKDLQVDCSILHEPRQQEGSSPDFRIEINENIIGYVEVKKTRIDLTRILKSEQIKRYCALSDNIILTNYHEFLWIKNDTPETTIKLFILSDLELDASQLNVNEKEKNHLKQMFQGFFKATPIAVANIEILSKTLAVRTRYLNEFMAENLHYYHNSKLQGLYETLKTQLHPQLTITEFADTYAQMLTYGLFLAGLNNEKKDNEEKIYITLKNVEDFIPKPFALMKELVSFLKDLEGEEQYIEIKWVVEEILFIINTMDRYSIAESLSFKNLDPKQLFKDLSKVEYNSRDRDPFINFYEDFLAVYDKETRKERGVYYTPIPIVNFIVRSLDEILKNVFEIQSGFADDKKVTVLDFACGTGTFMLEIFQYVLNSIGAENAQDGKAPLVIKEHLLKNVYGFELLIAAYANAHLKLWQYLTDKGYKFQNKDRLQIFLTNTLENMKGTQENLLLPALSEEAKLGQEIKDKKILVITGNPPYSGHSHNPSQIDGKLTWIGGLIEDYKKIDNEKLKEKTLKWLQDDYVKFIRFAQHKMEEVDEGIVGIITNHGFIDNPTFRGMRYSLMQTFDQIYILDLHGNSTKGEIPEGNIKDQNIFNIKQGVAISFFIKKKGLKKGVFHYDWWGTKNEKFIQASKSDFNSIQWKRLSPDMPECFFIPQNDNLKHEYKRAWSISDIFYIHSVGITTARDYLTIQFTPEKIKNIVKKLLSVSFEEAKEIFKIKNPKHDWKVRDALEDLKENQYNDSLIKPIQFRIFDTRFIYHTRKTGGFTFRPRNKVMDNLLKDNLALITVKHDLANEFNKVFITKDIADCHVMDRDISYVFPLYIYPQKNQHELTLAKDKKTENFQQEFRAFINKKYNHEFSPEEIMAYIYAVLHAPTYRFRYREYICHDFPRIPFCDRKEDFEQLAKLGKSIINFHIIDKPQNNLNFWHGKGDNFKVDEILYIERTERLYINGDKYLYPVSKEIWDFNMGGYPVLAKYLKNRKGEILNSEAIHVENIIDTIKKTIDTMTYIDFFILKVFPQWHSDMKKNRKENYSNVSLSSPDYLENIGIIEDVVEDILEDLYEKIASKKAEINDKAIETIREEMHEKFMQRKNEIFEKSINEYSVIAENGDMDAQYKLGCLYQSNEDDEMAKQWYQLAAEQGHASAQLNLGLLYNTKYSKCANSSKEAEIWLRKAAEQGNSQAQLTLAEFYYNKEKDSSANEISAYVWANIAIANGNGDAKAFLEKIEKDMVIENIIAAQEESLLYLEDKNHF